MAPQKVSPYEWPGNTSRATKHILLLKVLTSTDIQMCVCKWCVAAVTKTKHHIFICCPCKLLHIVSCELSTIVTFKQNCRTHRCVFSWIYSVTLRKLHTQTVIPLLDFVGLFWSLGMMTCDTQISNSTNSKWQLKSSKCFVWNDPALWCIAHFNSGSVFIILDDVHLKNKAPLLAFCHH